MGQSVIFLVPILGEIEIKNVDLSELLRPMLGKTETGQQNKREKSQ